MSTLNIQPTQMCTMCGISGDIRQRGNFTKQVGTGKKIHHISVCRVSPWNTGPQSMDCLNQLSSGQNNSPETWLSQSPQTINPQTQPKKETFRTQDRARPRDPKTGRLLIPFDTGQMSHTDTGCTRNLHTTRWLAQCSTRQGIPENRFAKCHETMSPASQLVSVK